MVKLVIQRVTSGSVRVAGNVVASITRGLVVLVGLHRDDTPADAEWASKKIVGLRLWPNQETEKPWDVSVKSGNMQVLLVSQFTLLGVLKGESTVVT